MSSILETAEKEIIRREILCMCDMAAPNGADTRVLRAGLQKSGCEVTEAEVERQAAYLQGKGLVQIRPVENKALNIRRSVVCITPSGTDLLEGNADDIAGVV